MADDFVLIDTPNTLLRIDSIWAVISVDADGNEGVCAASINGMMAPLIAADEARLASIIPMARTLAKMDRTKTLKLVKLTNREEVMTIGDTH
jgi:hypothetical protein